MNILMVDASPALVVAFQDKGHSVTDLQCGGGVLHLPSRIDRKRPPDLVLQQERLGRRTYLSGLERMDCPTAFWAIDAHLNMFWQQWYGGLFDLLLTPHVSLFGALPKERRPARVERFAMPGQRRAWIPHAARTHGLALCARLDEHRQIRNWLVALLQPVGLHLAQNLSSSAMMDLYGDSRMIANECIANEVNFRLLEGASAGCLVLGPDVGPDQAALLEPGRECLVYHDGQELLEQIAWATGHPESTEDMGRAAIRRVQAEHLMPHRADALLRLLPTLRQHRLTGGAASLAFWIVLARQKRNGLLPDIPAVELADQGLCLVQGLSVADRQSARLQPLIAAALAQALLLFAEGRGSAPAPERAFLLCRDLLEQTFAPLSPTPALPGTARGEELFLEAFAAASAFALRSGDLALARACWRSYAGAGSGPLPRTPAGLCFTWAAAFQRRGHIFDQGFRFDAHAGMLPESALSWLIFARHLDPACRAEAAPLFDRLLREAPSLLSLALGYLAEHSLIRPGDWRLQLDYGLASLKACRVSQGLHEIEQAREKARTAGKERQFLLRLHTWRPGNRDWQALLPG